MPFYALGYDSSDNAFITILHQFGIPYTDASTKKAAFWSSTESSPVRAQTIAAMDYFRDLHSGEDGSGHKKYAFAVPRTWETNALFCTKYLENGNCLFTIGSSGGLNKPKFEKRRLDIYPILYKDADHKIVISQGTSLALLQKTTSASTDEEYDEEMYRAFTTMVELTTKSLQAQWVSRTGYFPASKSAMADPTYQKILNGDVSDNRLFKLYHEAGVVNTNTYDNNSSKWTKFVDPGFRGSSSIRAGVKDILPMLLDEGSLKTTTQVLQENWDALSPDVR